MQRCLPVSGVRWRITKQESISLGHEILERGDLYDASLLPNDFTTFADIGCNVGYFTCLLAHHSQGRHLRGLMLDANSEAVHEARWHAHVNQMPSVHGVHGIVGESGDTATAKFFLNEASVWSSSNVPEYERASAHGQWTEIIVPCVRVESEWSALHGEARCHVLKVDIEGSELNFLRSEPEFLRRVDYIILEWHKWRVQLNEVQDYLQTQSFELIKILSETEHWGTGYFKRIQAA